MEFRINTGFFAFDQPHHLGEIATHPLVRLVERLLPWQLRLGDPCSLVVHLSKNGPAIHMTGEIAHVEQGRLGMHCTDIDLESVTHLRRLVELNLGDEAALQRELSALVGIDAST